MVWTRGVIEGNLENTTSQDKVEGKITMKTRKTVAGLRKGMAMDKLE